MGRGGRGGRGGCGGPSRNPGTKHSGLNSKFVPSTSKGQLNGRQHSDHQPSTFSLAEEARNTELHHSWNSDLKLRYAKVQFVNAGKYTPEDLLESVQEATGNSGEVTVTKDTQTEKCMANLTLEERPQEIKPLAGMAGRSKGGMTTASERDGVASHQEESELDQDVFFTDINGSSAPAETGFSNPVIRRSLSIASSDCSEEVIVFPGRNRLQANPLSSSRINLSSRKPTRSPEPKTFHQILKPDFPTGEQRFTVVDDLMPPSRYETMRVQSAVSRTGKSPAGPQKMKLLGRHNELESKSGRQNTRRKRLPKQLEEDEILADYIENMEEGEDVNSLINGYAGFKRVLGGTDSEGWQDQPSEFEPVLQPNKISGKSTGWHSTDLKDLDDISTSDEVQAIVKRVLSKRTRPSGVQYLVICQGYTVDDARWIPLTSLDAPSAKEQIRAFESKLVEMGDVTLDNNDSDDSVIMSENVAKGLEHQLQDLIDEQDLLDRKQARMTDEQIARLLSKQEELGLGSDELMLFDDDEANGSRSWDDEVAPRSISFWNRVRTQPTKKARSRNEFPSAGAFADVLEREPYNGFDVMDYDRPSLRKKPKNRRGQLRWELSDSELENAAQTAWDVDRSKKKIRKQEREELRAQGLLGKKGNVDMKAKYVEGMSWEEVKIEISRFLVSSKETLPLPPMNPHDRKRVHDIANIFNLRSKSVGGGASRFPTLYKTSRTTDYDGDALSGIENRMNTRRFMHRPDKRGAKGPLRGANAARKGRGSGFASAGVSYRDGEVVGATAPEIGSENKGRTMLEKMGWSTGTALGALNNKGIMQPVTHVVKTTKAGLG